MLQRQSQLPRDFRAYTPGSSTYESLALNLNTAFKETQGLIKQYQSIYRISQPNSVHALLARSQITRLSKQLEAVGKDIKQFHGLDKENDKNLMNAKILRLILIKDYRYRTSQLILDKIKLEKIRRYLHMEHIRAVRRAAIEKQKEYEQEDDEWEERMKADSQKMAQWLEAQKEAEKTTQLIKTYIEIAEELEGKLDALRTQYEGLEEEQCEEFSLLVKALDGIFEEMQEIEKLVLKNLETFIPREERVIMNAKIQEFTNNIRQKIQAFNNPERSLLDNLKAIMPDFKENNTDTHQVPLITPQFIQTQQKDYHRPTGGAPYKLGLGLPGKKPK